MDSLLQHLQNLIPGPWEDVLDAGTGRSSLAWLCSLACSRWTAVTAEAGRAELLQRDFASQIRAQDKIVVGNWRDPELLQDEQYQIVVADYLLGSLERYSPHFQVDMLWRLKSLTRGHLCIIGLQPLPDCEGPIQELTRFRDACHLLCGRRSHRELPLEWVENRLAEMDLNVVTVEKFENHYGAEYFQTELGGLQQILRKDAPSRLRGTLLEQSQILLAQSQGRESPIVCGFDYLVVAEVPMNSSTVA